MSHPKNEWNIWHYKAEWAEQGMQHEQGMQQGMQQEGQITQIRHPLHRDSMSISGSAK